MLVILKISLVLKWMTYSGEKVLGYNFLKRREYSNSIACPRGDISSTRKPAQCLESLTLRNKRLILSKRLPKLTAG